MDYPGVEFVREMGHYVALWAALAGQLGLIWRRAAAGERIRPAALPRPPSDATWFVPVYVCGLSSLYHAWYALFGISHCFGVPEFVFAEHARFAFALLAAVVAWGFLAEHLARRVGLPARAWQGALPLAVVAALLGVAGAWAALFLLILPLYRP